MILSAGLTPAWQQIMLFHHFRYGEVNRACEVALARAGKGAQRGHRRRSSRRAEPDAGHRRRTALAQIDHELAELGVPRRWIVTQSATRVCTTILDRTSGEMTELVENGKPLRPEELDAFRRAYAEEAARAKVAVITGSLPAGTPELVLSGTGGTNALPGGARLSRRRAAGRASTSGRWW